MSKTVVDPANYEAAATIFGADVADTLISIYEALHDKLAGIGSMAGRDPAGTSFGAKYDLQAAAIARVTQDVVNGCYKLAGLLSATGFNHGQANEASILGGPPNPRWTTDPHDYSSSSASLTELRPSSGSGGVGSPFFWYMVVNDIDYPWPDGNPGKVHSAAAAWSVAAQAITTLTNVVPLATGAIAQIQSIEVEPATTVCNAMGAHLRDLSAAYNAISTACTAYATDLDQCQTATGNEVTNLAESTVTVDLGGWLGALETLGIDEEGVEAANEARLTLAVNRISGYLTTFVNSTAAAVAQLNATVVSYLASINQALVWLLRRDVTRSSPTGQGIYQTAGALGAEYTATRQLQGDGATLSSTPPFSATADQLRRKYKHAAVFGLPPNYNSQNGAAFENALATFASDPGTANVPGTYRNQPAILAYNVTSGNIVILHLDGSYWTNFRMRPIQQASVITNASIGGD